MAEDSFTTEENEILRNAIKEMKISGVCFNPELLMKNKKYLHRRVMNNANGGLLTTNDLWGFDNQRHLQACKDMEQFAKNAKSAYGEYFYKFDEGSGACSLGYEVNLVNATPIPLTHDFLCPTDFSKMKAMFAHRGKEIFEYQQFKKIGKLIRGN